MYPPAALHTIKSVQMKKRRKTARTAFLRFRIYNALLLLHYPHGMAL